LVAEPSKLFFHLVLISLVEMASNGLKEQQFLSAIDVQKTRGSIPRGPTRCCSCAHVCRKPAGLLHPRGPISLRSICPRFRLRRKPANRFAVDGPRGPTPIGGTRLSSCPPALWGLAPLRAQVLLHLSEGFTPSLQPKGSSWPAPLRGLGVRHQAAEQPHGFFCP
jgi:hypothetical protein